MKNKHRIFQDCLDGLIITFDDDPVTQETLPLSAVKNVATSSQSDSTSVFDRDEAHCVACWLSREAKRQGVEFPDLSSKELVLTEDFARWAREMILYSGEMIQKEKRGLSS